LILLSMPRQPSVERQSPVLLEYSAKILEVGAREGLDVVDGRAAFERAMASGKRIDELFADSYHPKPYGHRLLAQELGKRIVARLEVATK
jgi:hypothetical protein